MVLVFISLIPSILPIIIIRVYKLYFSFISSFTLSINTIDITFIIALISTNTFIIYFPTRNNIII